MAQRISAVLEPEDSLPAAGQGALGIECLAGRRDLIEMLHPLNHQGTAWCVRAERSVSRALAGSCVVPLGAFAWASLGAVRMHGFVASPDGTRMVAERLEGGHLGDDPEAFGQTLAEKLAVGGAREILAGLPHD
jgi:hydroxymethylbilane synthase